MRTPSDQEGLSSIDYHSCKHHIILQEVKMAFEKYGFIDAKIKKALITNRKEIPIANHAYKADLLAGKIRQLEDNLMSRKLTFQEISEMQEKISELKRKRIQH
jgi:hypothetical protein